MKLELLLAHADDGQPVLREGLGLESLRDAPRPGPLDLPENLWDEGGDPNQLARQRWGLVAPRGPEGERLLELVAPLRRLREEAQGGAPARVYRVGPDMDGPSAMRWKRSVFRDEDVPESERPRYLLVLGELDQVSLELQQVLSSDAYVGRLAFPTPGDYASYVEKVLRWERSPVPGARPRLITYTARDGSEPTTQGYQMLTGPGLAACRERLRQGHFPDCELHELVDDGSAPGVQLLSCVAESTPSVLFSLSHGMGAPREGWHSADEQRARQGALMFSKERCLTGADVASCPFLPGGLWFFFACFSVGMPRLSAYTPWLRQLSATVPELVPILAGVLAREGGRPFISRLPQVALANENGPLAVMGHVDLAWAYSFNDRGRGTPSRFFEVLEALVEGRRVGPALRSLLKHANEASTDLTLLYQEEERALRAGRSSPVDPMERAQRWLLRHDLAGYVLLGDPAVRLPLAAR
jgi:hypothetical protein